MSNNGQDVIADYIIGTLYRFEHVETALLGEFEDRRMWPEARLFAVQRVGEVGRHAVLVTTAKMDKGEQRGFVLVKIEWLNTSGEGVLRGAETHAIDVNVPDEQIELCKEPCANIIERVLTIYRDVLNKEGVAGPIEKLAPDIDNMDEFEDEFDDEGEAPDENQVW